MQKKMVKTLVPMGLIAALLMGVLLYFIETSSSKTLEIENSDRRLAEVTATLDEDAENINHLTESLGKEYISKAKTFAYILKYNPELLEDTDAMESLSDIMGVDELHVTDEKGKIIAGNIPDYYGFDFATSDQAKEFLKILDDTSLEIAQDPQPNGAEGKLFQYIGVARQDKKGIIQIGMTPQKLNDTLAKCDINEVFKNFKEGNTGFIFAISADDKSFAAYPDDNMIGKSAIEAGLTESEISDDVSQYLTINDHSYFCNSIKYTYADIPYYIYTALPYKEMIAGRNQTILYSVGIAYILLTIMFIFTLQTIHHKVTDSVMKFADTMKEIDKGNLDININIRHYPEFETLSDCINKMASTLRHRIEDTERQSESQRNILRRAQGTAREVEHYSDEMNNISNSLKNGVVSQQTAVDELSVAFDGVSNEARETANLSESAAGIVSNTKSNLAVSADKIHELEESMEKIDSVSNEISSVVKTIDNIAFQTNILALNAAVEAARAGAYGKGFAVVAEEVRSLATKSAEAASGTTELIDATIDAVHNGNDIVAQTADAFTGMISGVKESVDIMNKIIEKAQSQSEQIDGIKAGIQQISHIVNQNAEIAVKAHDTSNALAKQVHTLNTLAK